MSDIRYDLNSLAQETLELSENIRANMGKTFLDAHQGEFVFDDLDALVETDLFDFSQADEGEQDSSEPSVAEEDYDGPGLIFKLEKGISTFCIRAIVSEELAWDREALEKGDVEISRSLKIQEDREEFVGFFPCADLAVAETIVDQMVNRRFPRQEAMLCNLSDPGFSWWMDKSDEAIRIYFQSHGIERDDSLIQLGPLGDPMIAFRRLSRCLSYLKNVFPVNEFSATDKAFMVSTTPSGVEKFRSIAALFLTGDDEVLKNEELVASDPTFSLYLRELAALRRFWIAATHSLQD